MARTMSDLLERAARALAVEATGGSLDETRNALDGTLSELDAERAAHEETKAAWKAALDAHRDRETETKLECMRKMDALKARLALAEAVCDRLASGRVEPLKIAAELSAWRAAK